MQTREEIERVLDASSQAVEAALVAIYERQTAEEKASRHTRQANGVGFNKFDAEICTSFVLRIKSGKPLTPNQLPIARKKMKRYWRQLLTVMHTEPPKPCEDVGPALQINEPRDEPHPLHNDYGTW